MTLNPDFILGPKYHYNKYQEYLLKLLIVYIYIYIDIERERERDLCMDNLKILNK